jgi:phosphoglycolate phosphatase
MYDALVFDLDGTLWDSTASVSEAWALAVIELGEELPTVTPEEVSRMMGMTLEEIFQKYFPQLPVQRRQVFSDTLLAKQKQIMSGQQGVLYRGVQKGLAKLAQAFPLYLVSNCHVPYLDMFFDQNPLRHHFLDWECYGRTGKPKADNLQLLLKKHRLKRTAYVGDTAGDQIAATKAGMDFYHAAYGFGEPDADCMRFNNFSELTQFFLGLKTTDLKK